MNSLNNNDILLTSKNDNDNINSEYSKITNIKNNITNNKNQKIAYKFSFNRRTYDTNINKNTNNYHTTIFQKK
jgi:hypothetical protein